MNRYFQIYDAICSEVSGGARIDESFFGDSWAMVGAGDRYGIAMATDGESIAPRFGNGLAGLTPEEAAPAVMSWNLREASLALAAVNAVCNTPERIAALNAEAPINAHYTDGIDFRGRTVGIIGHMHGAPHMREQAKEVYILERAPRAGDYPDSACDYILPKCDIVLITGTSLINKTLPHLLSLCENAVTVLTGPSVPLCPALLELGLDRIAGLALTDRAGITRHVRQSDGLSPYRFGVSFMLTRE